MIKYYTNRELAEFLNLNLAKWKRWSREFLPPDPLGGMQSGYARQYNRNDAFTVFVGGYLVKDLNFSIPEAKQILSDLKEPLIDMGFLESYDRTVNAHQEIQTRIKHYMIFITTSSDALGMPTLRYSIRGILAEETIDMLQGSVRQIRYFEMMSAGDETNGEIKNRDIHPVKVLPISGLFNHFMAALGNSEEPSPKNS